MFERQIQHLALLLLLVLAADAAVAIRGESVLTGAYAGISTERWLVLALAAAVAHQVYISLVWRTELHHSAVSRALGRERGFAAYAAGFLTLAAARIYTLCALATSNALTLDVAAPVSGAVVWLLAAPALYTLYSVAAHFGFARAMGTDHFDPAARSRPFVRRGIFRICKNSMYTFGFLGVWIPAFAWRSEAALLAAAFSHAYIWVHYYCTELPDVRRIYHQPGSP